jgi:hypothetical protein
VRPDAQVMDITKAWFWIAKATGLKLRSKP